MTLRRIGLPCVLSPPAPPHGLRQNTRPSGYAGVVALRFASMCSSEATLRILLQYMVRRTGERRTETFVRSGVP